MVCGRVRVVRSDAWWCWAPRAANRFHFTGGARFVHGGAMPQEVVVPVVTVTQLRGKKTDASKSQKVGVQVLGTNHKVTTPFTDLSSYRPRRWANAGSR